ncbi:Senescence-specific cysteine protease SAG39, partial [Linum perenne]
IEGAIKLKTGKLLSLSEQELVDCDVDGVNSGCEGGLMDDAFKFILTKSSGLTTETNYPYQAEDGICNKKRSSSPVAKITGYEDVPKNNEHALESGVFRGSCGTDLDHAVTAVGYGYMRIQKDGGLKEGLCGLAMEASYPTV